MVRVRFRISDTNVNHEIPIGPIIYNTEHIHQNDGVEVGDPHFNDDADDNDDNGHDDIQ